MNKRTFTIMAYLALFACVAIMAIRKPRTKPVIPKSADTFSFKDVHVRKMDSAYIKNDSFYLITDGDTTGYNIEIDTNMGVRLLTPEEHDRIYKIIDSLDRADSIAQAKPDYKSL